MKKYALLTIVLAIILSLTSGFAQQTSETLKSTKERQWNRVIDNDTLPLIFNGNPKKWNTGVSVVGQPVDPNVPSTVSEAATASRADSSSERSPSPQRFTLKIGLCGNSAYPTWCPKEIHVREGDAVELDLVNDFYGWRDGPGASIHGESVSFVLTAAEPIEACFQQPIPIGQRENCRKFPQFGVSQFIQYGTVTTRFTASEAGRFKYYDGFHRSGYGLLVVDP